MDEKKPAAIADQPAPRAILVLPAAWPSLATLGGIGLLVVLLAVAYFPAIQGQFIWDDNLLVANNKLIHASDGIYRLWFTTEAVDYWPVTNTLFWLEWRWWGVHTIGYHVVNLLLHLAAVLLLWATLRNLSIPGAYLAALLFAVHPVNVESVAWIAQGKNTLALLFFLLSILSYLREIEPARPPDRQQRATRWYWLSLLAFVLAMLSKGSVAILPIVLLLIVWWQRRGITSTDLWRGGPFFVVALALTGVNIYFQTQGGEAIRTASLAERLTGAGAVPWFYLSKALLPIGLIFVYPQWPIDVRNPLWWLALLAALVVTAVLWRQEVSSRAKWSRPLLFAWAFFCVALLPVLGLTDVYFMKFALVADHYQYIALVGVVALAAAGWSAWHASPRRAARWSAIITAFAVIGALTWLARQQSRLYTDAMTLYEATLKDNPDCWLARVNLGQEYLDADRRGDAIAEFTKAVQLKPDLAAAHNNLGQAWIDSGAVQQAIPHLEEALRIKPDYADAHDNLANALVAVGRTQEARAHFQRAIELKPDVPEFYNNAAIELALGGQMEQAIQYFQRAVELRPSYAAAHKNLAVELLRAGRADEAVEHYLHALQLKPDDAAMYAKVLNVYPALNRPADAIATAQKALDLARSSGQADLAEQIEAWLTNYRIQQGEPQNSQTPGRDGPGHSTEE